MEQLYTVLKQYFKNSITIENVARDLYTNRTYLSHYINDNYHCTFKNWIQQLRIEQAKQLLHDTTNLAIYEISDQVGYADHSCFTHAFTRSTGVTPKQWRKQSKINCNEQ
jgi:two-component system response regulator YesN